MMWTEIGLMQGLGRSSEEVFELPRATEMSGKVAA